MRIEVTLPELGEGVTDGFIVEWLREVGDPIEEGEVLVEVMTDKANIEVPSPASGTVAELLIPADERVKVGEVIAILEN